MHGRINAAGACPALTNSYLSALWIILERGTEGLYWVDSGHKPLPSLPLYIMSAPLESGRYSSFNSLMRV